VGEVPAECARSSLKSTENCALLCAIAFICTI
jgi:hypothetical protein